MTPRISILDRAFAYVPAGRTDIQQTWRRFAWVPVSEDERRARLARAVAAQAAAGDASAAHHFA